MNRERVNDRAKLLYHRLVSRRLARDPSLVEHARRIVSQWSERANPQSYVAEWRTLLPLPIDLLRHSIAARDEHADRMRLSSPFPLIEELAIQDEALRRRLWRKARLSAQ